MRFLNFWNIYHLKKHDFILYSILLFQLLIICKYITILIGSNKKKQPETISGCLFKLFFIMLHIFLTYELIE